MRTANNQKHCHIQEDLSAPQYNYRTLKSWVWYAVSTLCMSTDVPTTADNVTQSNLHCFAIQTGRETQLSVLKLMAVSHLLYASKWWVHEMTYLSHIHYIILYNTLYYIIHYICIVLSVSQYNMQYRSTNNQYSISALFCLSVSVTCSPAQ